MLCYIITYRRLDIVPLSAISPHPSPWTARRFTTPSPWGALYYRDALTGVHYVGCQPSPPRIRTFVVGYNLPASKKAQLDWTPALVEGAAVIPFAAQAQGGRKFLADKVPRIANRIVRAVTGVGFGIHRPCGTGQSRKDHSANAASRAFTQSARSPGYRHTGKKRVKHSVRFPKGSVNP